MSFRDLFTIAVVAISIPIGFRVPFVGLLTFTWLAYMRPQDLCWGMAREMRLSYIVGITVLVGWAFHESVRRPFTRGDIRTRTMLWLALATTVSLLLAKVQDEYVMKRYFEFLKILLIALFTVGQVTTETRLRQILWTIALSLGFFGIKGGLFGILSGGSPIIRGPGGMLEDNNDFALALVMNIPLLHYLGLSDGRAWVRRICLGAVLLTMVAVFLTHSRGAFLSLVVVLGVFWLRSQRKLLTAAAVLAGVVLFFVLIPEHVIDRYMTITKYEEDGSARGRIMAWTVARGMILDYPIWGVGMRNFLAHFMDYIHGPIAWAPVAHNSYLQIWAEGGTVGFALYMVLIASSFWTLRRLRWIGLQRPDLTWVLNYSRMLECSLAGFVVGSFFLNRAHFDLVYHVFGLVAAFGFIAHEALASTAATDEQERLTLRAAPRRGFASPGERLPRWGV